jgi:hypothetical protein
MKKHRKVPTVLLALATGSNILISVNIYELPIR